MIAKVLFKIDGIKIANNFLINLKFDTDFDRTL